MPWRLTVSSSGVGADRCRRPTTSTDGPRSPHPLSRRWCVVAARATCRGSSGPQRSAAWRRTDERRCSRSACAALRLRRRGPGDRRRVGGLAVPAPLRRRPGDGPATRQPSRPFPDRPRTRATSHHPAIPAIRAGTGHHVGRARRDAGVERSDGDGPPRPWPPVGPRRPRRAATPSALHPRHGRDTDPIRTAPRSRSDPSPPAPHRPRGRDPRRRHGAGPEHRRGASGGRGDRRR